MRTNQHQATDVMNSPSEQLGRACRSISGAPLGRHNAYLSMSATKVGRLVVAGQLDEAEARDALLRAAEPLVAYRYCNCTTESVARKIAEGLAQPAKVGVVDGPVRDPRGPVVPLCQHEFADDGGLCAADAEPGRTRCTAHQDAGQPDLQPGGAR